MIDTNIITRRDIESEMERGRVSCSIYITGISLDNLAREIKKLSKKYKDYKIEMAEVDPNLTSYGSNLLFNIIKKGKVKLTRKE